MEETLDQDVEQEQEEETQGDEQETEKPKRKYRSKEEMAALRSELSNYQQSHPDATLSEIAERFGLKLPYAKFLLSGSKPKKSVGGGKKARKEKPVEDDAESDGLSLSDLAKEARKFADLVERVAENVRKKAEQLFL